MSQRLWPWPAYAAMIAAAGLPIYLHAPKFYIDSYGVSLASMGLILLALRLIDVVQDPLLGLLAQATRAHRGAMTTGAVAIMTGAMIALFVIPPPFAPTLWFALTLTFLFSSWSFLTIAFYAQGVARAESLGPSGHIRLAGWRETGSLLGVCLAAVAPVALASVHPQPFALFALGFAALALMATIAMRREWTATPGPRLNLRAALADPTTRRLLFLAFVNGAPVAVTSTLFLFFVESALNAPGYEGPFLLIFFLSAALSAPLWVRLANRLGPRQALLGGMILATLTFAFALTLGPGDLWPFALICLASGAGLGADLTLLPALFARHLARRGLGEATGFGLWSFAGKLSLAAAAGGLLPLLQSLGFQSGGQTALTALTLLYAALPCALKLLAIALLLRLNLPDERITP
ncbi:MFS transporter [Neogemmobacter tilapiae]|uniref:Sugar:cation symporter n=1 Tax=Neogemmobacter tilapiae TaxID=875041 RepID=A0A918TPQ6_9RHOB|nr:MFS transporter [Gemmobacter tilapiae]GHC56258.1 sugar:cation symporter [Gemmobacter tilapiae]